MRSTCAEITFERGRGEVFDVDVLRTIQAEYAHEVMVAVINDDNAAATRYQTGTPVSIQYGRSQIDAAVFLGYVHHAEPHYTTSDSGTQTVATKVVCIGASLFLKQPSLSVWSQRTLPSIVLDIANTSYFTADVQADATVYDNVVWRGETAWSFICGLARRLGWTCYTINTELFFHDRGRVLRNTGSAVGVDATAVHEFRELRGDLSSADSVRANRVAYGVDPRNLRIMGVSNNADIPVQQQLAAVSRDPLFKEFETGLVLNSPGGAASALASATEMNRWHVQAQLEMDGDVRARPARLVSINGLNKQSDGYWYAPKVQHEITPERFTTFIDLGRDSSGDTGVRPPALRKRVLRQRLDPFGSQQSSSPPSLLVGDVWRSAWQAQKAVVGV